MEGSTLLYLECLWWGIRPESLLLMGLISIQTCGLEENLDYKNNTSVNGKWGSPFTEASLPPVFKKDEVGSGVWGYKHMTRTFPNTHMFLFKDVSLGPLLPGFQI